VPPPDVSILSESNTISEYSLPGYLVGELRPEALEAIEKRFTEGPAVPAYTPREVVELEAQEIHELPDGAAERTGD
jgi:hypothetical protein